MSASFSRSLCITLIALTGVILFSSWGSPGRSHVISDHQLFIDGQLLGYKADAGYLTVGNHPDASANIFYTAYTSGNTSNRPLTFVFNGGPGSASIWLHMGANGPVRTVPGNAGYQENPNSWLGFTDLVFIDPVSTGYSRAAAGTDAKKFFGYHEDIRSIAEFIQAYLTANNRQHSPIYLTGESYGAARAVGLADYLQDNLQINVSGLTLLSPALDYNLLSFRKGNNMPYAYYLPTYALAALYHHKLSPALQNISKDQIIARVNEFAKGAYTRALKKNGIVSKQIIDTLSYYTGLDKDILKKANGRITDILFTSNLLKQSNQELGTFDSRLAAGHQSVDPAEAELRATFPTAFQQYLKERLHYTNALPYLATIPTPAWNNGTQTTNGYLNVTGTLKNLLQQHSQLKVQVISGDYDLATPAATVQAALVEVGASSRITLHNYAAGHMPYTDDSINTQLKHDSEDFYR